MSQEAGQETQQDALWKRFFKAVWFIFALFGRTFRILFMVALILGVLVFVVYTMQLDENVRSQFEGKRWELPARVFARPLDCLLYTSRCV